MSGISTHVLDVSQGRPAKGVPVLVEIQGLGGGWKLLGKGQTDADGRGVDLLSSTQRLQTGIYRLRFDTTTYFRSHNVTSFYPEVSVMFAVRDAAQHYHIPLLLSPFGYTTYRGS